MGKDTLDQRRYFDTLHDALCYSIKHWKRICAYIKAEMYDEDSDIDDFDLIESMWKTDYGDSMHGDTCPLCNLYENSCCDCILEEKYHNGCNDGGSPWHRTVNSESWEDMLENAKGMVRFLERVKHELVEGR